MSFGREGMLQERYTPPGRKQGITLCAIPIVELTGDKPSTGRTWAANATRVVPGVPRPTANPAPKAWASCNSGPNGEMKNYEKQQNPVSDLETGFCR